MITSELLAQAQSYDEYHKMVDELLAQNKTTGNNHSQPMLQYSRLNVQRMNRVEKTMKLTPDTIETLQTVQKRWIWLVLVEAWCGDVPGNLPMIQKMADVTPNIEVKIILRDEHLAVMDAYLTDGGRAIPKLVCLNADTLKTMGSWGPRPAPAQAMMRVYKSIPKEERMPYMELVKKMQVWYAKDKGKTIQKEFQALVKEWVE